MTAGADFVKVSLIGCGGIAEKHLKGLLELENVEISALYDTDHTKSDRLRKFCRAKVYRDVESCIDASDVVYILTPPASHKDIALKAIHKKKHIFIEKPVSVNIKDAEKIVQAAKYENVKTMVGFNMRYRPAFKYLKEQVTSESLGEIHNIWSLRMGSLGGLPNWRTSSDSYCGMTIESLSHDIDIFHWLLGDIRHVRGTVLNSKRQDRGDDNASVIFEMKSGATAIIHASWSSHLGYNSRGIIGSNGTAMISGPDYWDFDQIRCKTLQMNEEFLQRIDDRLDFNSYREENKYFLKCIAENKETVTNVEYGLAILKICHSILESSEKKSTVELIEHKY